MPTKSRQTVLELVPVSVTLNKPDVLTLDTMAAEGQTNRSSLIRTALQEFIARQDRKDTQSVNRFEKLSK